MCRCATTPGTAVIACFHESGVEDAPDPCPAPAPVPTPTPPPDQPCATETIACMGSADCAAIITVADGEEMDNAACMANTECNAIMTCQIGQTTCGTEMLACQADTDCAAALAADGF